LVVAQQVAPAVDRRNFQGETPMPIDTFESELAEFEQPQQTGQ
jgi:hypothetical protein